MSAGLVAEHLGFAFAGGAGVLDVSLVLVPGRITGFLGRNGAGKTTTMRLLAGVLVPQKGRALVDGVSTSSSAGRRLIGFAPEEPPTSPGLTVREQLHFAARLAGPGLGMADVVTVLDLGASLDRLVGVLSKGTRQRVGTAMALLGAPRVLLLDEPTAGLDPAQVLVLRDVLRSVRDAGTAILLSSHVVAEVAALCDDVTAIAAGRTVYAGDIGSLAVAVNAAIGVV